ncbi:hypothetical protein [Haladaptatus sp.]|uniref:hypothetical protein n=1 Tax=Haladaptatus sp. TaxID=1973141 RepID=UPI003C4C6584
MTPIRFPNPVPSPTTKTLHGAVETVEGPFAVGAGGTIVERTSDESSGGSGGTNNTSVGTNGTTNASSLSIPDTDKTVKRYREGVVEFE